MPVVGALPPELRIERNNLGTPAVAAVFTPSGVFVVAAQRSFTAAVAHLDGELGAARVRVLAAGKDATWGFTTVAPLPGGRVLLCPRNVSVDPDTLDVVDTELAGAVPATTFGVSEKDVTPRDAFALGGRLIVAHGSFYADTTSWRFASEVPATGEPVPWVHDLEQRIAAYTGTAWYGWHAHRSAVLGEAVVLAGQRLRRSGSGDHALLALDAAGSVVGLVARDRALIRDAALSLVADRGRLLVAASGTLEVLDAALDRVAAAPAGHPFTRGYRLLAGDGTGRLLWYDPKRHTLVLTGPDELAHDALEQTLGSLAAAAEGAATPVRKPSGTAAGTVPGKAGRTARKQVPRHRIDTAMDGFLRERRQELLDLLADPAAAPHPTTLVRLAEATLSHAAMSDRDDPVVWLAVRALAQGGTAELLAFAAMGRSETVEVPFADRIAAVPARNITSVSPLNWRDAWYAAVIAGETRCLDLLEGIGDDAVSIGGGLRHAFAMKHALVAYRSSPAAAAPHVREAVAASAPEHFASSYQWQMHAWHTAAYPLLLTLAEDDAAGFDTALVAALKAHKKWFGSKSHSHAVPGWVALGPQAMCCLAADRGIAPAVESDYLLPALTERRFVPA